MDEPTGLQAPAPGFETHQMEDCGTRLPDSHALRTVNDENKAPHESDLALKAKESAPRGSMKRSDAADKRIPVCAVCLEAAGKTCSKCKMIRYCSVEHQKMDWNNHKKMCTSSGLVHPTLLFLNTGDMQDWIDETFDDFFILVGGLMHVSRVVDARTAMETLTSSTCPSYIIVGDQVKPRSALVDALVQRAQIGGTVVFGMGFPRFAKPADISEIFGRFGLSWKAGIGKRARFALNHDEPMMNGKRAKKELLKRSVNPLPNPLQMDALLLKEVPSDQAIYLEVKHGHGGHGLTRGNPIETPIAFAPVGQGWVGYIGDIEWEGLQGFTEFVMRAMIGLRIHRMPILPFLLM